MADGVGRAEHVTSRTSGALATTAIVAAPLVGVGGAAGDVPEGLEPALARDELDIVGLRPAEQGSDAGPERLCPVIHRLLAHEIGGVALAQDEDPLGPELDVHDRRTLTQQLDGAERAPCRSIVIDPAHHGPARRARTPARDPQARPRTGDAARNRSNPARASGRSSRPKPIRKWLPGMPELRAGQEQDALRLDEAGRERRRSDSSSSRRGKPIDPPRGRTQAKRSAWSAKNPSSWARFAATIRRDRARTASRARSPMSARISDGADEQIVV